MTVPCQNFPPTTINAIVLIICTVIISMSIALSRIMCLINFQEPLTYHFCPAVLDTFESCAQVYWHGLDLYYFESPVRFSVFIVPHVLGFIR